MNSQGPSPDALIAEARKKADGLRKMSAWLIEHDIDLKMPELPDPELCADTISALIDRLEKATGLLLDTERHWHDVGFSVPAWFARVRAFLAASPAPETTETPFGWARGWVQPGSPDGPAEHGYEFCEGDNAPDSDGWFPLYRGYSPKQVMRVRALLEPLPYLNSLVTAAQVLRALDGNTADPKPAPDYAELEARLAKLSRGGPTAFIAKTAEEAYQASECVDDALATISDLRRRLGEAEADRDAAIQTAEQVNQERVRAEAALRDAKAEGWRAGLEEAAQTADAIYSANHNHDDSQQAAKTAQVIADCIRRLPDNPNNGK